MSVDQTPERHLSVVPDDDGDAEARLLLDAWERSGFETTGSDPVDSKLLTALRKTCNLAFTLFVGYLVLALWTALTT